MGEAIYNECGVTLYHGDCREVLRALPEKSVNCCVTSPPYWGLRDYGVDGQIGLEQTPDTYVSEMVAVFREVRRVLADDGTLWLNLGDSYCANKNGNTPESLGTSTLTTRTDGTRKRDVGATGRLGRNAKQGQEHGDLPNAPNRGRINGVKPKDLIGVPWAVAFALRADGWYLRSDIIWHKPNPMPESVTDRPTKAHEYLFLLSKSERYYYNADAIAEPASPNTHARVSQDLAEQVGSYRANGGDKTNGPMKAVMKGSTRKLAEAGSGIAANRSYEAALALKVENRNKRTVWTVGTMPYSGAHFATFPPKLIEPCILAGCPHDGVVLDPFFGAGTTGVVCRQQHVRCLGIELNRDYCDIAMKRLAQGTLAFGGQG